MTDLLEIRDKIKYLYSKYETFILPFVKFLLAFVVLKVLNGKMGYMTKLDNIAIELIVALMYSFLPTGSLVLFTALFSLLHMYALSLEVAVVGLSVYLAMFLLFLRLGPRNALLVVLTPLFCAMKIPYVIPIVAGLLCAPVAAASVGCGVVVDYLLRTVIANRSAINTLGEEDYSAKLKLIIDGLIKDKAMVVTVAAFVITVIVVYLIRRMSIDYAWSIAMVAGAMTDIVILLLGDLVYDTHMSVGAALLGSILALIVAKVIEFFTLALDYRRTEKVQFEDDEYYYYVKAVPKMTVATPERTVKQINHTQYSRGDARRVVTERTAPGRTAPGKTGGYGQGNARRSGNSYRNSGRSVTVRSAVPEVDSEILDEDNEDLF